MSSFLLGRLLEFVIDFCTLISQSEAPQPPVELQTVQ